MAKTKNPWISVKKKLPRQNQTVVCKYVGVYGPTTATFHHDGENTHFYLDRQAGSEPATHWRKL